MNRLITTGHWQTDDPEIWIVGNSGYDGIRLAFLALPPNPVIPDLFIQDDGSGIYIPLIRN